METVQSVRFYNGGDRKFERLSYTAAEFNQKIENGMRYHVMDAPRKGFFEIPREIQTETGGQMLGLPREVMEKYGHRGFVMVDRNIPDERAAGEPFMANSDETARTKGDSHWREYCFKCMREYEDNNEKRKAMGMAASRPSDFIVHAYKELGMTPPGAEEEKKALESKSTIEALQEQVKLLTAIVTKQQIPEAAQPQASGKGKG